MKPGFFSLIGTIILLFIVSSCGDDVSSMTDPGSSTIVTAIVLQNAAADSMSMTTIPELKLMDLTISKRYNNGTTSTMLSSEISSNITWELDSNSGVQLVTGESSNNVRLKGTGTADLIAKYQPTAENGFQQIISNIISFTVIESNLISIEVKPDSDYSVGCDYSDIPSSELIEGCLMQFQVIGHYDNDTTADFSDEAVWHSEDENKAIFVADLPASIDKDWFQIVTAFLDDNNLRNKTGLVLGKSTGGFEISATHETFSNMSDTVTIVGPELYSMGARINTHHSNYCYENCQLYENIIINLEIVGTYTNNVSTEITRQSIIQSDADPYYVVINTNLNEVTGQPIYTGVINIRHESPENVTFTIKASGITTTIDCVISQEELQSIERTQPRGSSSEVFSLSNTSNVFSVKGNYNNDQFELLDANGRLKTLNLERITWSSSNESVATIDQANMETNWDNLNGIKITTTAAGEGALTSIKAVSDLAIVDWTLTINNTTSVPISLSISPSDGDAHVIEAGVDTQFSALAVFNNQTSEILEEGRVVWSSVPADCVIDSSVQPCITGSGVVTTNEAISITATTSIDPSSDISTSLGITVTPTNLVSITVVPDNYSLYERDTVQFSAIGLFSNNRSQVLHEDCITWSIDPFGDASVNEQGILTAINESPSVMVTATSLECITEEKYIPSNITGNTNLTIQSLPRISLSSNFSLIAEDEVANILLTFKADATFDEDIIVPYEITGSATVGSDFNLSSGNAVIPSGSDTKDIIFSIIDDILDENNETIEIDILVNDITNGKADATTDLTIIIEDNESPPVLSVNSGFSVAESCGSAIVTFEINRVSGRDISIHIDVTGDVNGEDYSLNANSLTMAAGDTEANLILDISNDSLKEGDEQLVLEITADYADTGSIGMPTLTITDDDPLAFLEHVSTVNCIINSTCSYQPKVNSSNPLDFNAYNLPVWMSLIDPNTGKIQGTAPASAETTDEVIICAEDQTDSETACLMPFTIIVNN